jgi:paired amphipathic helix protein Sin3a
VYNAAVERQFFDETRETLSALTRDGGQNWGEFLKCLDMYAQEILTRSDMLKHVEPILGKRNSHLFEEFKRILSVAGSSSISNQVLEDSWYSVPLAEIDFSRCRKCSPSYRALPRDYPAHPCSGRTAIDLSVLNDIWVSLPVGSEESYTFRHMRRNTYEEQLFRVEDERFEIDMIIDSNRITMQRLMPIAEEIALLAKEDIFPTDLGIKPAEGTGLGGRRFAYSFDKKILGVIHRNAITRIYGDSGQEMLELLVKNPTVTVPLVVERLAQKDKEFKLVRERLGRQWKEIAEQNYHKSLDHRSLTWRTTDKRAISTRTLVAEIKDRAMNCGKESKEAYRSKLDKAKEERGGFYETTVGSQLSYNVDTTFFPKPDRRIFTPHLTLVYENVSWAQRDAYRIMAFALERGPIPPADKERCHRLWVEFLGPWFDLSLNWMQKPAVTYQESSKLPSRSAESTTVLSEDDEESMEDADMADATNPSPDKDETMVESAKECLDHHPLPAGAHVSTLYGEGKIISFRRADKIYAVRLAFGAIGYLRPATVLCSILPVEKSAYTRQLRAEDRTKLVRANDQLAFGTQNLYLFFRLHQILVSRLNVAKKLAFSVGDDSTMQTMVEQMPSLNPTAAGRRRYEAYLSLVYALLDGSIESGKYEDRVRSLLGHHGYALATMDKLIAHIWKDVQAMANDETMWNLVQLYRRHLLAGSFQPDAFRQEAAYLSDGEVMYAFQHCPVIGRDESVLYFEYVGVVEDEDVDPNLMLNQPHHHHETAYHPQQFDQQHDGGVEEPATKRSKKG